MSLAIQGALNRMAGTDGLGEQAAANAAVSRISNIEARAWGTMRRSGAISETFSRAGTSLVNNAHLSSGRLSLFAIHLDEGTTVTSIGFIAGTTGATTPTAQWFALYDSDLALIDQTADDTTTAWSASTVKELDFASPPVTTYSGLHYLGINVTAATPPSLWCVTSNNNVTGMTPILGGTSTTGLTTTAPATAAAISATSQTAYAWVN